MNRNKISIDYNVEPVEKKKVNLQYCNRDKNIGDLLSKVVVDYMLAKDGINNTSKDTKHLFAIGSIIDFGSQDATIWGSGLLNNNARYKLAIDYKKGRKLDIRCVRGPYTKQILLNVGYECPDVYGDPAIIMPLIYNPEVDKEYDVSVITHIDNNGIADDLQDVNRINKIEIQTDDYKYFVAEIKKSKKIISSSLHGIILAEAYGVPAVFVARNVMNEIMKFYDWYESTDRADFLIASSVEMALEMEPMKLPKLGKMSEIIMDRFPYDIYL